MKEVGFISELEKRAELHKKLVETEIMPDWAKGIGGWLTVNPWRVIVPLSVFGYVMLRMVGGVVCENLCLDFLEDSSENHKS